MLLETSWRLLLHLASDCFSATSSRQGLKLFSVSQTKPRKQLPEGEGKGKEEQGEWKWEPKLVLSWLKLYLWHPLFGLNKQTSDPSTRREGVRGRHTQLSIPSLDGMPDFRMKPKEKGHGSTREPLSGRRQSAQGCASVHKCSNTAGGQPFHTCSPGGGKGPEHHCREDHIQNKIHETDLTSKCNEDEQREQKSTQFLLEPMGILEHSMTAKNNVFHKTKASLQMKTWYGYCSSGWKHY